MRVKGLEGGRDKKEEGREGEKEGGREGEKKGGRDKRQKKAMIYYDKVNLQGIHWSPRKFY